MDPVELFTKRAGTYHRFIRAVGYGAGLARVLSGRNLVRPGARVLDAGCGTGAFTRAVHAVAEQASSRDVAYHAFDLTPAMLAHLDGWARAQDVRVASRVADVCRMDQLPPEWRDFDLIVSSAMLEYLAPEQLPIALAGLASRLSPGGTLVVCISRRNLAMRALIGAWWQSNLYSRREVGAAFQAAGLRPTFSHFPGVFRYLDLWGIVVETRPQDPGQAVGGFSG